MAHSTEKSIFTDLDGTIIPEGDMVVGQIMRQAFENLVARTNTYVLTGRTFEFAENIFSQLGLNKLVATENGARILNPASGDILRDARIPENLSKRVLKAALEATPDYQCRFSGDPLETTTTVADRDAIESSGIFILDLPKQKARSLIDDLGKLPVSAYISTSWLNDIETCDVNIHHTLGNKRDAMEYMARLDKIDYDRIIAIGNDINDLPMFDCARLTAAPVDAHPLVRENATFTIPSAINNGFLSIIDLSI